LLKDTFLCFEVYSVLLKDVKDLYYDGVVLLFCLATEDEDVIHVDSHNPFVDEVLKMSFILFGNSPDYWLG